MWYFTSNSDQRVLYMTPETKEIIISRNHDSNLNTFPIFEDSSISRKHAVITASEGKLFLQDLGSRYGTFINENIETKDPLNSQDKVMLNSSDTIKFGKLNSVWKVHNIDFITCTSTLKGENLQNLKVTMEKIGGELKNEWDDACSFLTMPAITLTIKVVLALVQGAFIVTPDYWNKCYIAITQNTKLPDPKFFTPEVIEPTLNKESVSFSPNNDRRLIFAGKKFIFFSRRQMAMYNTVLTKGSATVSLISESKMTKSMLCMNDVIVIQYSVNNATQESQMQKNQINDIMNYLKSKNRRLIPESEICLAVLFNSIEKNCNPEFNLPSQIVQKMVDGHSIKESCILAKESQDVSLAAKQNIVIDETLVSANDVPSNNSTIVHTVENQIKRKLSDDSSVSIDIPPAKRRASEKHTELKNENEELFDFVQEPENFKIERKLNFPKPQKRKAVEKCDDDLFQFIPEDNEQNKTINSNLFNKNFSGVNCNDDEVSCNQSKKARIEQIPKVKNEFTPICGIKLKDLRDSLNDTAWKTCNHTKQEFEQEETIDLKDKMNNLDIGTTVIKIRDDLIKIEKKPLVIETPSGQTRNFKTFKKVWPLKMQVTVISKSPNSERFLFSESNKVQI